MPSVQPPDRAADVAAAGGPSAPSAPVRPAPSVPSVPVPPERERVPLPPWAAEMTSALDTRLGLELLELTAERVVGRMPVAGNTQPFGLWHGGASCVLAETLGSLGSYAHARPERIAVGVDLNATHHRAVSRGWVTGTATALRLGRSVTSYEVVLVDDDGRRVCTARLTCQLVAPGRV